MPSISAARRRAPAEGDGAMQPHRLADLVPHGVQRRERGHRLLEDHRDPPAADLPHRPAVGVERCDIHALPCPLPLPRRPRGSGSSLHRSAPRAAGSPSPTARSPIFRTPIRRPGRPSSRAGRETTRRPRPAAPPGRAAGTPPADPRPREHCRSWRISGARCLVHEVNRHAAGIVQHSRGAEPELDPHRRDLDDGGAHAGHVHLTVPDPAPSGSR